jgi:polyisoprenoid-binding protein YceI
MPTLPATTTTTVALPTTGTWLIDPIHSDLRITARHLMVAKVRGTFGEFEGTIVVTDDPGDSRVEWEANAASVDTGAPDRDAHLRSADFLDVEEHPRIRFVSTGLTEKPTGWRLSGELTIRGVTRTISLDMTFEGEGTDPYGNTKAAFTASGEIDRRDWGLVWNVALEGGGVLVSEKLKVEFDVEATLHA